MFPIIEQETIFCSAKFGCSKDESKMTKMCQAEWERFLKQKQRGLGGIDMQHRISSFHVVVPSTQTKKQGKLFQVSISQKHGNKKTFRQTPFSSHLWGAYRWGNTKKKNIADETPTLSALESSGFSR